MAEPEDVRLARNLVRRFNLASESIRQIILPEPDRDKRLYYLESVPKEDKNENQPRLEKYFKLKDRDPKWEERVASARKRLEDFIRQVQDS